MRFCSRRRRTFRRRALPTGCPTRTRKKTRRHRRRVRPIPCRRFSCTSFRTARTRSVRRHGSSRRGFRPARTSRHDGFPPNRTPETDHMITVTNYNARSKMSIGSFYRQPKLQFCVRPFAFYYEIHVFQSEYLTPKPAGIRFLIVYIEPLRPQSSMTRARAARVSYHGRVLPYALILVQFSHRVHGQR